MTNSFLCSNQGEEGYGIFKYDNGTKSEVKLSSSDQTELLNIVKELFSDIDDELRLYVDSERVESVKNEDKVLEIIFDKETELKTKSKGEIKFNRLLIPLSGDLFMDTNEKRIIFLTGNPDYSGSPLISNCDEKTLEKFLNIIDPRRRIDK